jgi:hypothetical protein
MRKNRLLPPMARVALLLNTPPTLAQDMVDLNAYRRAGLGL